MRKKCPKMFWLLWNPLPLREDPPGKKTAQIFFCPNRLDLPPQKTNEISPKLKCNQHWNGTKTEMSPKLKCHQNWNVIKTEMSPKLKCPQNWNVTTTDVTKTEILELKCHQNWKFTKTDMSPRLKYHKNWNVTKTDMSPKRKYYLNWYVTKSQNAIKIQILIKINFQEMGTDHLGLVLSWRQFVLGRIAGCPDA